MSAKFNQVIEEVKHLTAHERALVAHCLISSLETKQDEGVDMAWADLAKERYNELLAGTVKSIPWEQIKKEAKEIPQNKVRLVQAWIEIHKEDLIADWELASSGQEIFKIEPLR